jgi:hypothetical protein
MDERQLATALLLAGPNKDQVGIRTLLEDREKETGITITDIELLIGLLAVAQRLAEERVRGTPISPEQCLQDWALTFASNQTDD